MSRSAAWWSPGLATAAHRYADGSVSSAPCRQRRGSGLATGHQGVSRSRPSATPLGALAMTVLDARRRDFARLLDQRLIESDVGISEYVIIDAQVLIVPTKNCEQRAG